MEYIVGGLAAILFAYAFVWIAIGIALIVKMTRGE